MRRNTVTLVCSLALRACRQDDVEGEASGIIGEDDDDLYPDDPEPVCDLSQFPELVPEWIV